MLFIKLLSFPPVSGTEYPDDMVPISETYGHNPVADPSEAKVPIFASAMLLVGQDHAFGSAKAYCAVEKATPFFWRFCLSLAGSHSNEVLSMV